MDGEKWMIVGGILVAVFVIEWLRSQAFQNGRMAGIREAVTDVSRSCSYHDERKDEPLPEKVDLQCEIKSRPKERLAVRPPA